MNFTKFSKNERFLAVCTILFVAAFAHIGPIRLVTHQSSIVLLYLIIGTVVSDVTGFFFGSFFGWHKLPEMFNKRKSWEGVLGQVIGAWIGVLLIKYFILYQGTVWLFLPIGLGSALGDLANSRAKRIAEIKNWSNFIPGHGGFIDRFCSLAGSSLLTFYYLLLFTK